MLFVGKCENLVKAPTEIDDLQGAFNDSANAPEQGTCGIQVRIRGGWCSILEILKPQGSHVGSIHRTGVLVYWREAIEDLPCFNITYFLHRVNSL